MQNSDTIIQNTKTTYQCLTCFKSFEQKTILLHHLNLHSDEKFMCNYCGKKFKEEENLRQHHKIYMNNSCVKIDHESTEHLQNVQTEKSNKVEPEKKYQCVLCTKSFKTKGYLSIHLRIHTGEKPFECEICGKCFTHKNSFDYHTSYVHFEKQKFEEPVIESKSTEVKFIERQNCSKKLPKHSEKVIILDRIDPDENIVLLDKFQDFIQNSELYAMIDNYNEDNTNKPFDNTNKSSLVEEKSRHKCNFCQEVFGSFPREENNFDGCYLP